MIFELNKNLFKVDDNYICVSDEEIKEGDWVLETLNKVIFRVINEGNDYAKSSFKKIINSTQFINESIPVLNINDYENSNKIFKYTEENLIEAINLARVLNTNIYSKEENDRTITFDKDGCGIAFAASVEEILQEIEGNENFKYSEDDLRNSMQDLAVEIKAINGSLFKSSIGNISNWIENRIKHYKNKEILSIEFDTLNGYNECKIKYNE